MDRGPLRLTLLRHGRSRADDEGVHEGRYDSPLTTTGRQQAKDLGAFWAQTGRGFDLIETSPLARARETADIVAAALGRPVVVRDEWMERDNGPLAGLDPEIAAERYPIPETRTRFDALTTEGGESSSELGRRAEAAIERLIRSDAERVLVVAHGGILCAAVQRLLNSPARFVFADTAFYDLEARRDRDDVALLHANVQPHVPGH